MTTRRELLKVKRRRANRQRKRELLAVQALKPSKLTPGERKRTKLREVARSLGMNVSPE
jgi:hypothetical protein